MANKVYITLEVDDKGSATMKKFGGNADQAFDKLKKNAKAGAAQAGKMERAWKTSANHINAHWKAYAVAGAAAVAAVGYAIKQFADASREEFKKYNTAVTDMGKITDESAESIKNKIGSIGPKYGDATELTKAYYNVISAGVTEPVAAMDTLKESVKAAKAAHIESAETVTGITALMEAYGDKIKGASESADLLFQIEASGKTTVKELIPYIGELAGKSAALGISQDELGASFAQVTLLSGSTSNAATQYKAILTSLMAPSTAMTDLLGKYGGAQKAIADMGFEGVLKLIAEESGGNAAALQKLMGSAEAVGGTLTLLGGDMEGYSQRLADMKDKTGLAEKAFKDWEKSMEGIEATYDASVKNIMIAFGEEIAPMVASSMQLLIDIAPKIISAIHTAFDFVQVSYISLVDHVMRGLIDLEYAFKTMVAGIEGAWNSGIDLLEEGFADFLDAVAAGLDKIPFFSDNATASMRELADKVRANTDASDGFVASIMNVQAAKEKEVAAHNKVIDVMMAEALGYKETTLEAANAAVEKEKAAKKAAAAVTKTSLETVDLKEKEISSMDAMVAAYHERQKAAELAKLELKKETLESWRTATMTETELALDALDKQFSAYDEFVKDKVALDQWYVEQYNEITKRTEEASSDLHEDMKNAMTGWASSFSGTLNDMLWGADVTFKSILESFAKMITQMLIQKHLIENMFSGGSGGWFGAALGFLGGLGGGAPGNGTGPVTYAAQGGIFPGGISGYSNQIVDAPTQFTFARGAGLMGESGPEVILPLARTPSGDLGVKSNSGTGTKETEKDGSTIVIIANDAKSFADMVNRNPEAITIVVGDALREHGDLLNTIRETI